MAVQFQYFPGKRLFLFEFLDLLYACSSMLPDNPYHVLLQ